MISRIVHNVNKRFIFQRSCQHFYASYSSRLKLSLIWLILQTAVTLSNFEDAKAIPSAFFGVSSFPSIYTPEPESPASKNTSAS